MIGVLVVDDDTRVARVNAAYVAKVPGFRVVATAHSAGEALARLAGRTVDLVLLDHYLPDGNGLAVVRELRRLGHQTDVIMVTAARDVATVQDYLPDGNGLAVVRELRRLGHQTDVIMVTAARDVATVQDAKRHGALPYLVKPFNIAGLRTRLEAYAALRHTLDGGGEAEQAEVDRIFATLSAGAAEPDLPKGHSPTTAEVVRRVLLAAESPLSAQEIAERAGVSRQTAQRCLKLLDRTGRVRLSLRYGETGRPEHRYVWAASGG